jgi:stage II sporulation protein P
LTLWDALRLIAAVALCAAAVFAFRAQGGFMPGALLPDWWLDAPLETIDSLDESAVIVDGMATFPAEELNGLSEEASSPGFTSSPIVVSTTQPAASVRINLLNPDDNLTLSDAASSGAGQNGEVSDGEVTNDSDSSIAPGFHGSSDSSETGEAVPEQDLRIDTVTRKRDGAVRVLIYHTHTEEAYSPTPDYTYRTHGEWHTQNLACSIAKVGDELAFILTERYGWEVTHDTTDYEPPNFDTAYARSLQGIAAYTERGETFDLYIDMHRDSYSNSYPSNTVAVGDAQSARMRLLVGKGGDFSQKPDWERNLALSNSITDRLNVIAPTLAAPVYLSPRNRYNQHVSPNSILIEVGNNRNTMEEALVAVPYLAEALDAVMGH